MNLKDSIKKILKESFDTKSTFKRNVYGKNEEYRQMTKDKVVIWNSEYGVGFQYIFDDEEIPGYTFVHLYPYSEGEYHYKWEVLTNSDKSKIFIDAIKKLPKVMKEYFKKFGKLDKIVFRPKTSQMGKIYSSPSVIKNLEFNFGSDYDIEVNTEVSNSFPLNTVIMKLKNTITESFDDLDFLKGTPNPFLTEDPLVVLWLDETATKEQITMLWDMLQDSGIYTTTDKVFFIHSIFDDTSKQGIAYIKTYVDYKDNKRMTFGDTRELFEEFKYTDVRPDLKGKPYTYYYLKDIFN